MPIRIPFVADVAAFLRGTGDAEDALEDVSDALDDLGTNTGAGRAETDLETLGDTAETTAERMERSFSDAFDQMRDEGRTATRRIRDDVDEVGGDDAFGEFRDEAQQNLAESVASFQGDAESAVDAVQSTFGGLAASLGPAGVVGAAVVAAGIGLVRGMAAKAAEATQEIADKAGEIAGSLIEAGSSATSIDQINEALQELATTGTTVGRGILDWGGDASTALIDLRERATTAGVSFQKMALGVAAGGASADRALEDVKARLQEVNEAIRAGGDPQLQSNLAAVYADESKALKSLKADLEKAALAEEVAAESARLTLRIRRMQAEAMRDLAPMIKASVGSTNAAAEAAYGHASASEVQATASKLAAREINRKNEAMIEEASLSLAASNATIAYEQAVDDATAAIKENGDTHDVNSQKGRENQTALNNLAGTLVALAAAREEDTGKTEDYNQVIKENRADFLRAAAAAGYTKEQAKKLADQYGLVPKEVKTKVTDDGTAAATKTRIDEAAKDRDSRINVDADMSGVDTTIRNFFNGKVYRFNVAPRPGQDVAT